MYKLFKYYDLGYIDGINNAIKDKLVHKKANFKIIKTKELKAKLYDLGYIDGYNNTYKKLL